MEQVSGRLDDLDKARRNYFSYQEIEVLFGNELVWQQSALERLAIRQNTDITEVEKKLLLQQHYQTLTDLESQSITPTLQLVQITKLAQTKALTIGNYNQLAAEYGPQAADRLIALAERQQKWQHKLSDFDLQKQELQRSLSGKDFQIAVKALKTRMFHKNEIKRLEVLSSS